MADEGTATETPKPVIHDPQSKIRKFEDDRREARQKDAAIMNLRNVKTLQEKVESLTFRVSELELENTKRNEQLIAIMEILKKASEPKPRRIKKTA